MRAIMSLTAALTLSACLAACSTDDDQPTILAPPSPSPAVSSADSSASTEVNPPVMPPEAEAQTADGAMAFVRHYFAVVDYAYSTGDTAPLAKVSDPECGPCTGIKEMVDEAFASSQSFERGPTAISGTPAVEIQPEGWAEVTVTYSTPPLRRISDTGTITLAFAEVIDARLLVFIVPAPSGWSMRSVHETA